MYVYDDIYEGFRCCACPLPEFRQSYATKSRGEMIAHLECHREHGHTVPQYVFDALMEEIETEGDAWSSTREVDVF